MLFESITSTTMTLQVVLLCSSIALAMGVIIAYGYMYKNQYSKSFVVTLALLPVMIQIVIMMVNGNLGTSVAVLGTFSLIRFRSVAGSARDIGSIFFAMAIGLATGMGYVTFAVFITILVSIAMVVLNTSSFGEGSQNDRDLKITIPESLNNYEAFDNVLTKYATHVTLLKIKTTNMGSLFELHYRIKLIEASVVKELIDGLRIYNGNLSITCSIPSIDRDAL